MCASGTLLPLANRFSCSPVVGTVGALIYLFAGGSVAAISLFLLVELHDLDAVDYVPTLPAGSV